MKDKILFSFVHLDVNKEKSSEIKCSLVSFTDFDLLPLGRMLDRI